MAWRSDLRDEDGVWFIGRSEWQTRLMFCRNLAAPVWGVLKTKRWQCGSLVEGRSGRTVGFRFLREQSGQISGLAASVRELKHFSCLPLQSLLLRCNMWRRRVWHFSRFTVVSIIAAASQYDLLTDFVIGIYFIYKTWCLSQLLLLTLPWSWLKSSCIVSDVEGTLDFLVCIIVV